MRITATLLILAAFTITPAIAQQPQKPKADGELWLKSSSVPRARVQVDSDFLGANGRGRWFREVGPSAKNTTVFARSVGRWPDPTTLPQTRVECVEWASGNYPWGGGWKTCIGWKTQYKFMYSILRVQISTSSPQDISAKLDECLATAVVAGALSGILTSGAAGVTAFQGTLQGCLISQLPTFVSVAAWTEPEWEPDYH